MSIFYEVNVFFERDIEIAYRAWLTEHIAEILALPGFLDAQLFDVQQDAEPDRLAICMQYRLDSQTSLDNYFQQHAARLRADGIEKFGQRFSANRRVLINPKMFS
ncbi:MAG: DUF4286 family protein [Arenimonas sp.]